MEIRRKYEPCDQEWNQMQKGADDVKRVKGDSFSDLLPYYVIN